MRKNILLALTLFTTSLVCIENKAQTTINFDDATKWTAGSTSITSYAINHSYSDGVFSSTALPALRNSIAVQDLVAGANGTYSWRLRDTDTSEWNCTIASGGVSTFSMAIRRWDAAPSTDFTIEYSIDLGSTWNFVSTINNTSLDGLSEWKTFTGTINSSNNDIKIRIIANGPTERIMIDDFYWEPFGVALPTVSFDSPTQTVAETAGTITLNVNLTNFDANAIDVNVALTGGTAVNGMDFNFSPVTLTFPGGANSTQSFTVDILDDIDFEPTETIQLTLLNPTNGAVIGANATKTISITDNDTPALTPCTELFFSEYIEGSGNNKAIEIYNPSSSAINLANYSVRLYTNGSPTVSSSVVLTGMLNPGETFVIANSQSNATILSLANITSGVMSFTGNDALELYNTFTSQSVDIFGEIGVDPGAAGWALGTGTTQNQTLRRISTINLGSTVWIGSGNTEWDELAVDTFNGLKLHENTTCGSAIPLVVSVDAPSTNSCPGTLINFGAIVYGGAAPYTYTWNFGDGNSQTTSSLSIDYTYLTSGTFNGTLTVVDVNSVQTVSNFSVTILTPPTSGFTIDYVLCAQGADVTSTATGNNLVYSYTTSTNLILVNENTSTGEATFTGNGGSHSITQLITDADGCTATETQNLTITVAQDASFSLIQSICQGETVSLTANNTFGSWSGSGVTDNGDGTGLFTPGTLSGPIDITYSIIGICGSFSTETIEVSDSPIADFTFTGTNEITFTNTSQNMVFPSAIIWNFGDGNQETTFLDPTHEYLANSTYTVCMEVVNGSGCSDEICKTVTVIGVGVKENSSTTSFTIFPNPSNGLITVNYPTSSIVIITNVIGKEVYRNNINANSSLDLSHLPVGTYLVTLKTNESSTTKKIIIK
jgi:PKD repeat protein